MIPVFNLNYISFSYLFFYKAFFFPNMEKLVIFRKYFFACVVKCFLSVTIISCKNAEFSLFENFNVERRIRASPPGKCGVIWRINLLFTLKI